MTIRRRLHIVYILMLLSTVGIGAIAAWAITSWRSAASELLYAHAQGLHVEKLRGNIYRQIKEVLDRLVSGDVDAEEEFHHLGKGVEQEIEKLRKHARDGREIASITVLHNSYRELVALATGIFRDFNGGRKGDALRRMEEDLETDVFKNVEEQVEGLKAYYQERSSRSIRQTAVVWRLTRILVGIIIAFSLIQGGVLLLGIQRWLVKPLDEIGRSTAIISTGRLNHRIAVRSQDELGELAMAIDKMAQSLKEIQTRLVRSERLAAVGELASYIAHNIRNPLASIRSAAQVGLEELAEGDGRREAFQDIMYTVDKLESWVQRLLSYIGPITLSLAPQDLNQLIRDLIYAAKQEVAVKDLCPVLELSPLPEVAIDARWMEQVLWAIIANAIEASPQGGRLFIRSSRSNAKADAITIQIEDEGKGIPREILGKVFVPYFTTKHDGVGLGLAMAKKIVEAHQGAIELESEEGRGTRVTLHLPCRSKEKEAPDGEDPHHRG